MTPVPALSSYQRYRQLPGLTMVDRLFESRKPAILGANAWFGGAYRLEVDPDGNCFGTAWMVSSLLWAVQTPGTLHAFIARLKEAARPGGAFRTIGVDYQVKWRPHLVFHRIIPCMQHVALIVFPLPVLCRIHVLQALLVPL